MILSLDASTKSTGWAVFNKGATVELVDYGCIVSSNPDLFKRIDKMQDQIEKIIQKYHPDEIIFEEVHPDSGISGGLKTMKALMYLQGIICKMIHDKYNNIEKVFLMPNEWRKKIGIQLGGKKRDALKQLDKQYVKDHFGIIQNDDICDAICIGYGYICPEPPAAKKKSSFFI